MFDVSRGAHGPFPTSNWAVYLLPEYFESMVLINIPVSLILFFIFKFIFKGNLDDTK